jgi:hypothetical protein
MRNFRKTKLGRKNAKKIRTKRFFSFALCAFLRLSLACHPRPTTPPPSMTIV